MSLHYPHSAHPSPGTTLEVAAGVRWLTMPMGGSLNHINLYLIEDRDGWFVVDTGLGNTETKELWHDIFDNEMDGKPVKGVICTHMHPDHIGQAGMIVNHFRCPLYMTRGEYYQARSYAGMGFGAAAGLWQGEQFYHRYGMPTEQMRAMRGAWSAHRAKSAAASMPMSGALSGGARGVGPSQERALSGGARGTGPSQERALSRGARGAGPSQEGALPMAFHRLQDGDILTIGEHDWHVVVGSGHSPEHACLHCHSLGVMLSGDQILPIITSNVSVHATEPEANPLKAWMESHDRFLDTPDETFVLPAHNLPFYGVRERLRDLVSHHEDRMLAIEETCNEPRTAKELLPVLFKRKLDPRQTMMALGEAIAHCHLLMHRNRLKRTLGEDGRYRFLSVDPDLERRAHPGRHDAPDDRPILV